MAEDVLGVVSEIGSAPGQAASFDSIPGLLASSPSLQIALIVLAVGFAVIVVLYRRFSNWVLSREFYYHRPHLSRFVRVVVLPVFGVALISSTNAYIHTFELFADAGPGAENLGPGGAFVKMLDTINILVIGYTISQLIPILLAKREKSQLERSDFEAWKEMRGFPDDGEDVFHRFFKWVPPADPPAEMDRAEFERLVKTEQGRLRLEQYRTGRGTPVGSYDKLVDDPFERWKKLEREKYHKYFKGCISGNNSSGKKLRMGQQIEEIYPIDVWREEKRLGGFASVSSGSRPPGYARKKRKDLPKSFAQVIPMGVLLGVIVGVVSWWGINLLVLATAIGGLGVGIGFALQETMQNYFAYIQIRKDRIFIEGDRVKLDTGYNGYVHKITPRVTYLRHALNESFAIIPTRQLVNSQIINYTKEVRLVPAAVEVGVSYLNNPRQVAAILVKVGRRVMTEVVDGNDKHLVRQARCPYLDDNRPSCGCDQDLHVDVTQPVVRFNRFNDSSLDFSLWVYVRDYGSQFKTKTDMMMLIYEEFKRNDIRIPWPIRTVYQSDERQEVAEISQLDDQRNAIIEEYGLGDIGKAKDE